MENEKKDLPAVAVKTGKGMLPVWEVLKKSWELYRNNFKKFIGMYLLSGVAVLALALVIGAVVAIGLFAGSHWYLVLISVLLFLAGLCGFVYYVLRVQIALMILIDKPETLFWSAFKESRKHFWPYLWVTVLTQLIFLGIALVFVIILAVIAAIAGFSAFQSGDISSLLSAAPVAILLILVMILAIMTVAVYFGFSSFTYIYENKKGGQALKRSFELVKNNWWSVLWRYLAIMILFYAIVTIVSIPSFSTGDRSGFAAFWNFLVQVGTIIITPLFIIYYYFIFKDLQSLKSGK